MYSRPRSADDGEDGGSHQGGAHCDDHHHLWTVIVLVVLWWCSGGAHREDHQNHGDHESWFMTFIVLVLGILEFGIVQNCVKDNDRQYFPNCYAQ